jgi:hypothetical protein
MAQDISQQRFNVGVKAMNASVALVDALNTLLELKEQRGKFEADFQDTDFQSNGSTKHLTAAMMGTLFDFVVPALQTTYLDTSVPASTNGGRNQQILLQVRPG